MGYQLLQKTTVRSYIEHLKALKKESLLAGVDDLVEKYMRIAFADITDFLEFGRATVPVMGPFGPIMAKNLDTGKKEPLLKEVNDVRFKESSEVDGGLISEVKLGKGGASIKLLSQEKAMEWLGKYFEAHPSDRHKRDYDMKRLELDERALKLQESKSPPPPDDTDDDNLYSAIAKAVGNNAV
jgi:phage terminase small subunit